MPPDIKRQIIMLPERMVLLHAAAGQGWIKLNNSNDNEMIMVMIIIIMTIGVVISIILRLW